MAKFGEGDARWIVADRQDGTNVHNWHWAEKDVLPWAKQRITELLGELVLANNSEDLDARISGPVEVEGDAVINNRKNKLIPAYELEVKGRWAGTLKGQGSTDESVHGLWTIPYLAEENADEDPEIKISTATETAPQQRAKAILQKSGKKALLDQIRVFVKEIAQGGPAARSDSDAAPSSKQQTGVVKAAEVLARPQEKSRPAKEEKVKKHTGGKRTLESREKFYARAEDIYACFTDSQCVSAYTQSHSKIEAKKGGQFEIFGGSVVGKFVELKEGKEVVLDWRFRNWQEGDVSKVHLTFEEPEEGTTFVSLKHTDIPEEDMFGNSDVLDTTTKGWKMQIFHKIRAVFGYGLGL